MWTLSRALLPALLALAASAASAAAQVGVTTDLLTGRVTDPEGAPLAGVRVEAVSVESGVTRVVSTGEDGRYTLVFPDGGGRYLLRATILGHRPEIVRVARLADEEVLIADLRMTAQALTLDAIEVSAGRVPPPTEGAVGGEERELDADALARLPLDDTDPARLAALAAGVVAVEGDSADDRAGFSVAGQHASQNQVTVDGASFSSRLTGGQTGGGSPVGVPQEGVRATRVVTSTYDVSRGQFAGGLVATTTRSGTNRPAGSLSWQLRDRALQRGARASAVGGGYTQHRLSGGYGGPLVRDRWFYFLSFTAQRRSDALFALEPDDAATLRRLGVTPQAVDTFLTHLADRYGITGRTGGYRRTGDALSLLARTDYLLTQRHTLTLRASASAYGQENARIGFLETLDHGGEVATRGAGAIATLTSRLGGSWVNELRAALTLDHRAETPYDELPEGRVRVASAVEGVGRGFATLVFGGERSFPSRSRERSLEVANELSFLWRDTHRVRAGVLASAAGFDRAQSGNRLGSFEFASLDDFAAARPFRFTRQLAPRAVRGEGVDLAAYLGDTWRPTVELQVTGGVRLEASRFGASPRRNEEIEARFGRRTDRIPGELHLSPRLGFSWRLSATGAPLRMLRGGVGEFRGRAPYTLFATALEQTGLAGSELQLECVGAAVPRPDWRAYAADPASIPAECLDGLPVVPERRAPNVTVFAPGFGAPRSWRGSIGYQTTLLGRVSATLDLSHALGVAQSGARDLNLRAGPAFRLDAEGGRPVYAPAAAIDARTGAIPLAASRVEPGVAHLLEVHSELRSRSTQLTLGLDAAFPQRLLLRGSFTWSRARDQGSFGSGSPLGGFAAPATGGDPNHRPWATSDFDRRHSLVATVGLPLSRRVELSLIGRTGSGRPFTPLVGADVNGDGARNDAAFVFDPAVVADTALAAGMARLLAAAPARVGDCLRAQLGRIAARNACRGAWGTTLDLRATLRPALPRLGDRATFSLDAFNLAAGVDELLHGASGIRGWGQPTFRPDDVLLVPIAFDPDAREFSYRVNESFGKRRAGPGGASFQVVLGARMAVGAERRGR